MKKRRMLSYLLVFALLFSMVNVPITTNAAGKTTTSKYTLSKSAGTYSGAFTLKIKAKKGYKVYYTTGSQKFTKSKLIKSGKTKSIKIKKTTTVKLYAVKKSKIITNSTLKKVSKNNNGVKKYTYTIQSDSDTDSDSESQTSTTETNTTTETITEVDKTTEDSSKNTSEEAATTEKATTEVTTTESVTTEATTTEAATTESTTTEDSTTESDDTDGVKYKATFETDSHATIYVYYTQDYTNEPDESNVTNAVARDSDSGEVLSDGNGQINFKIVAEDGYTLDRVEVTPDTNYKNLKDQGNNIYRITKITGDLTVTITTIEASDEEEEDDGETPASIKLSSGESLEITSSDSSGVVSYTAEVSEGGTYVLSSDHNNTIKNLTLNVTTTDAVTVTLDGITAKNTNGAALISSSAAADVTIELDGTSKITGTLCDIDKKGGNVTVKGDGTVNVTTTGTEADGIVSKGSVTVESGTVNVTSTGDCIKGTNSGVAISGGTLNLSSSTCSAIKSKSSEIVISGGTLSLSTDADDAIKAYDKSDITTSHSVTITGGDITITKSGGYGIRSAVVTISGADTNLTIQNTAEDGIRAKAAGTLSGNTLTTNNDGTGVVNISNGTIKVDECNGDGIQAEYLNISGGDLDIKTVYAYAGTNFYENNNVSGSSYNSSRSSGSNTTETINYDTGSHKGLKVGTKAKTFSYSSVEDGSDYTAGTTYTQTASGKLTITGGTISIDTTATGIKYNKGNDDKVIIGSPDDGISVNNQAEISGGKITILASDDGISSIDKITITKDALIDIQTAYEGIEGKTIVIGTSGDSSITSPSVSVYTNDDGINASSKTLKYVYTDEDETSYTKTKTSVSGASTTTVYSGYVYVMVGDDTTHSVSLKSTNGDTYSTTYSSMGDGIDCNGSMYAYGGKTVVYGMSSGSESPIDMDTNFVCESGATMLLVGADTMGETSKISTSQGYIVYGSSSNTGFGGFGGPGRGGNSSASTLSTGSYQILSGSTALETFTLSKTAVYLLYTSPSVQKGSTYTLKGDSSTSLTAK